MDLDKLHQYQSMGLCCSQVMVAMGLYLKGETNDQLLQSVGGLCGGMGKGLCCGALTGAACMLSLFDLGMAKSEMIPAIVEWFEDEYGQKYGSINCDDILEHERSNRILRCPMIVENTYLAAKDILASFGFETECQGE